MQTEQEGLAARPRHPSSCHLKKSFLHQAAALYLAGLLLWALQTTGRKENKFSSAGQTPAVLGKASSGKKLEMHQQCCQVLSGSKARVQTLLVQSQGQQLLKLGSQPKERLTESEMSCGRREQGPVLL